MRKLKLPCFILGVFLCVGWLAGCRSEDELNQYRAEQSAPPKQEIVIKQETERDIRTLTVTGTGRMTVSPDTVVVRLSVKAIAETSEEAHTQLTARMDEVRGAVRVLGINFNNIGWSDETIDENMDESKTPPSTEGFTAMSTMTVSIENTDRTSDILEAAANAGAEVIYPIECHLLEKTEREQYFEALKQAVKNANEKAQLSALEAGVDIDGPGVIIEEYADDVNAATILVYDNEIPEGETNKEAYVQAPLQSVQFTVQAKVTVEYRVNWPSALLKPENTHALPSIE